MINPCNAPGRNNITQQNGPPRCGPSETAQTGNRRSIPCRPFAQRRRAYHVDEPDHRSRGDERSGRRFPETAHDAYLTLTTWPSWTSPITGMPGLIASWSSWVIGLLFVVSSLLFFLFRFSSAARIFGQSVFL